MIQNKIDSFSPRFSLYPMTCVICSTQYTGYGNNADPVCEGYCCDVCNLSRVLPERMRIIRPHTLLSHWKVSVEASLEGEIWPDTTLSVEDIYNDFLETDKNYECTFIEEDDLTPTQLTELLGKFDEDDDLTNIEALLFRYGTLMLYIKKKWVLELIQEMVNGRK